MEARLLRIMSAAAILAALVLLAAPAAAKGAGLHEPHGGREGRVVLRRQDQHEFRQLLGLGQRRDLLRRRQP
jgi:hypothetical protein